MIMPYATLKMIEENDLYRSSVLNLQASENRLSPDVKRALSSDLASRYSHLMENGINSYGGTSIFEEIYAKTRKDTAELFGSRYAEIRPVGGHIAVLAALMTVSRKGQKAAAIGEKYGGYPGTAASILEGCLT
jgi:Glycine/serine hydroxymethyltransferase